MLASSYTEDDLILLSSHSASFDQNILSLESFPSSPPCWRKRLKQEDVVFEQPGITMNSRPARKKQDDPGIKKKKKVGGEMASQLRLDSTLAEDQRSIPALNPVESPIQEIQHTSGSLVWAVTDI